jgi:hypothetical protein
MGMQLDVRSFTPSDLAETVTPKLIGKLPHSNRLMLLVPAQQLWSFATVTAGFGRERPHSWRPNSGRRLNANRITQSSCGQSVTEVGVVTEGDICVDNPMWQTGNERSVNLRKSHFWLGAKPGFARRTSLFPSCPTIGPSLRQIEIKGDRQRRQLMRNSERDSDLAVLRLAELAIVLPLDPDRMLTTFGKPSVVNDPTFDFAQMKQGGQGIMTNRAQERTITPGCDSDEVTQRLMFGAEVIRVNPAAIGSILFRCSRKKDYFQTALCGS